MSRITVKTPPAEAAQLMRTRFGPRAEWVARYRRDNHARPTGRAMWDRVLRALANKPGPATPAAKPPTSAPGWTADPNQAQWYRTNAAVYKTALGYEWWNLKTDEHATCSSLLAAQEAAS